MMKLIAKGARAALASTPVVLRDLLGLAGAGLVAYGVWLVYPPAGFIAGGMLLIVGALLAAMSNRTAG